MTEATLVHLAPDEPVLEDNYPVFPGFWYVMDGSPRHALIEGTVRDLKKAMNVKEVRRCNAVWRQLPM